MTRRVALPASRISYGSQMSSQRVKYWNGSTVCSSVKLGGELRERARQAVYNKVQKIS